MAAFAADFVAAGSFAAAACPGAAFAFGSAAFAAFVGRVEAAFAAPFGQPLAGWVALAVAFVSAVVVVELQAPSSFVVVVVVAAVVGVLVVAAAAALASFLCLFYS